MNHFLDSREADFAERVRLNQRKLRLHRCFEQENKGEETDESYSIHALR